MQKKKLAHHIAKIHTFRRERPVLFWLRTLVITLIAGFFVLERSFWTPDTLFAVFLIIFIVMGQARAFLLRFAPFMLLLLAYDSFRGIADNLNDHVNFWPMIDFDRMLFGGQLPTNILQNAWWHGSVNWYDFYFYFLYTIHFLAPIILAVIIWKFRPRLYWQYVAALVGLSFAAFVTFVLFPAAPPWMASDAHLIPQIHRVSSDVWWAMGIHNFSEVYGHISPNQVAAVPSLHSAYPLLFTLFVWRIFSFRKTWWMIIYPVSMWIGVIYMGEHYAFDVVTGALYAVGAYVIADRVFAWIRSYHPTFKEDYHRGYAYAYARVGRKEK